MKKMLQDAIRNFMQEQEGSVVEYILVLAVIAVIIAFLFPTLKNTIQGWFNSLTGNVQSGLNNSTSGASTYSSTPQSGL